MNWKKASAILVTLGVTATVVYIVYSKKYLATVKDFEDAKRSCANCSVFYGTPEEEVRMLKNIHNLTKKQLNRLAELNSTTEKTDEQQKEFDYLVKKWNYKIEK